MFHWVSTCFLLTRNIESQLFLVLREVLQASLKQGLSTILVEFCQYVIEICLFCVITTEKFSVS